MKNNWPKWIFASVCVIAAAVLVMTGHEEAVGRALALALIAFIAFIVFIFMGAV